MKKSTCFPFFGSNVASIQLKTYMHTHIYIHVTLKMTSGGVEQERGKSDYCY